MNVLISMLRRLLGQLIVFALLFLTWWSVYDLHNSVPVSGRIGYRIPSFPLLQIEFLNSSNSNLAKEALQDTTKSLLGYICPELVNEPWQSRHLFLNMLGNKNPELLIALALPPDRGILALIQQQNGQYVLHYYLDSLLPVTKIEKITLPDGEDILFTCEVHNERMGAYTETHLVKLWKWQNTLLQQIWSENSFWEINWLNSWQNPQAEKKEWLKLLQQFTVSYEPTPSPRLQVNGQQQLYSAPAAAKEVLPAPGEFKTLTTRELEVTYHWNEKWQRFILHTGQVILPDISPRKIAVIKDLENHLEAVILPEQKNLYQVIDQEGSIFMTDKKNVLLDP